MTPRDRILYGVRLDWFRVAYPGVAEALEFEDLGGVLYRLVTVCYVMRFIRSALGLSEVPETVEPERVAL